MSDLVVGRITQLADRQLTPAKSSRHKLNINEFEITITSDHAVGELTWTTLAIMLQDILNEMAQDRYKVSLNGTSDKRVRRTNKSRSDTGKRGAKLKAKRLVQPKKSA